MFRFFLIFFIFFFFGQNAEAVDFSRDLRFGDQGFSVRLLQVILNQDPATKVAETGPGSVGQETEYFGLKTKQAVIRLQNKYFSELLVPRGKKWGDGLVEVRVRAKLSELSLKDKAILAKVSTTTTISQDNKTPIKDSGRQSSEQAFLQSFSQIISGQNPQAMSSIWSGFSFPVVKRSKTMNLFSLSKTRVSTGDQMIIKGEGFSPVNNTIYTGYSIIKGVSSSDNKTLSFNVDFSFNEKEVWSRIPADKKISASTTAVGSNLFQMGVTVENDTGVSNTLIYDFVTTK